MANEDGEVDLVAALESLRSQLSRVAARRPDGQVGFDIPKIELELKVGVRASDGVDGSIGFKLFGIGLGGKAKAALVSEQVQTLRLELTPIHPRSKRATSTDAAHFTGKRGKTSRAPRISP